MGFFKKKEKAIMAMVDGTTVPIETVPDEVFSTKMMGDGIAIQPISGEVVAPCDGEISVIMKRSNHAIGIKSSDGMELLIHIGLDTVELQGEGFTPHASVHDHVKIGDPLISFDLTGLKEKGINCITMLVITEANGHTITSYHTNEPVKQGTSTIIQYR